MQNVLVLHITMSICNKDTVKCSVTLDLYITLVSITNGESKQYNLSD